MLDRRVIVGAGIKEHGYRHYEDCRVSGGGNERSSRFAQYSWPLEVGKESMISYLRENIPEKSPQTFTYRTLVTEIEQVTVPAGTFETFKVEVSRTGNLYAEYWYEPKAVRAVKEREYLSDGLREAELVSYKAE